MLLEMGTQKKRCLEEEAYRKCQEEGPTMGARGVRKKGSEKKKIHLKLRES